jgi:hypothetical protein
LSAKKSFDRANNSSAPTPRQSGVTHMLLYACNRTFAIDGSTANSLQQDATQSESTTRDRLAREAMRALVCGIELLLVHENDDQTGGCSFGDVITRTPHELVAAGLYKKIALAWHAGSHRRVSLAMVARALGARKKRSSLEKMREASRRTLLVAATRNTKPDRKSGDTKSDRTSGDTMLDIVRSQACMSSTSST